MQAYFYIILDHIETSLCLNLLSADIAQMEILKIQYTEGTKKAQSCTEKITKKFFVISTSTQAEKYSFRMFSFVRASFAILQDLDGLPSAEDIAPFASSFVYSLFSISAGLL